MDAANTKLGLDRITTGYSFSRQNDANHQSLMTQFYEQSHILLSSTCSTMRKHVPIAYKMAKNKANVDIASAGLLSPKAEMVIHGLDPDNPASLRIKVTNLYKMLANQLKKAADRFEESKKS